MFKPLDKCTHLLCHCFPHSPVGKETAFSAGDPSMIPGSGRSTGEGIDYALQCSWASLGGSAEKESTCNAGDLGSIPRLGRFPGEGKVYPLQCSGLENSMDYIVHGVAKSWTRVSKFHSLTHSHAIEVMLKILQTRLQYYENWEDSPESRGYQTS